MFESEERRIVERIKDYIKDEKPETDDYYDVYYNDVYIMLRNEQILRLRKYLFMLAYDKAKPQDAYVYITIGPAGWVSFHYPFINIENGLLRASLSKLGFDSANDFAITPATGLKYAATATMIFKDDNDKYLSVELVNLDTILDTTNLPKIVSEVVGGKIMSEEKKITGKELREITGMFRSQRLFAGYDFSEAFFKTIEYYDKGNKSLENEVARIGTDYYRIFHPYKVCYEMITWKEIDCMSINPFKGE